jgi:urease accessory protein
MLIERIIGNLDDLTNAALAFPNPDWLDLTWRDCARRTVRRQTRGGHDARILLPVGSRLRHHDVLQAPGQSTAIVVNLLPADVLVIAPRSLAEMGCLALEFGNLHLPVEVREAELIVLADGPSEALLTRTKTPHRREARRFAPDISSIRSLPVESRELHVSRVASAGAPEPTKR